MVQLGNERTVRVYQGEVDTTAKASQTVQSLDSRC